MTQKNMESESTTVEQKQLEVMIMQGMLGQGPHRFVWPEFMDITMPAEPVLHEMMATNHWPNE